MSTTRMLKVDEVLFSLSVGGYIVKNGNEKNLCNASLYNISGDLVGFVEPFAVNALAENRYINLSHVAEGKVYLPTRKTSELFEDDTITLKIGNLWK